MCDNNCFFCDCYDHDREGCTMASIDKSYACPNEIRKVIEKTAEWKTVLYSTDTERGCINHRQEVCNGCKEWERKRSQYCPNCGARMINY